MSDKERLASETTEVFDAAMRAAREAAETIVARIARASVVNLAVARVHGDENGSREWAVRLLASTRAARNIATHFPGLVGDAAQSSGKSVVTMLGAAAASNIPSN